jgi:DNA-directed RNA polymerase subunit N (RpoN/RPB10)
MSDSDFIKFYNCPQEICACVDENGDHTRISRRFREFYDKVRSKQKPVDVLREMGIERSCCRILFLTLPLIPMIDRSKNRVYDDTHKTVISEDTRELGFGNPPPSFPIL